MTTTQPDVFLDGKYGVQETASYLQVTTKTVQRWTNSGLMKAGIRRANGRRFWTGSEIIRVWRALA